MPFGIYLVESIHGLFKVGINFLHSHFLSRSFASPIVLDSIWGLTHLFSRKSFATDVSWCRNPSELIQYPQICFSPALIALLMGAKGDILRYPPSLIGQPLFRFIGKTH